MNYFRYYIMLLSIPVYAHFLMRSKPVLARMVVSASRSALTINYATWKEACEQLPKFPSSTRTRAAHTAVLTWDVFEKAVSDCIEAIKVTTLQHPEYWVDKPPHTQDPLFKAAEPVFKPFVEKLVVNPDSTVAFRGDLHGDIHSLLAYLDFLQQRGYMCGFKITDPNFYMVFLGDYVDRGMYGTEVIYTLARLKAENPERVTLVRGNHEDMKICSRYGFYDEFKTKFKHQLGDTLNDKFKQLSHFYDFLPVALYLGSNNNYIQCCHGGIEIGFNPKGLLESNNARGLQWLGDLNRKTEFDHINCAHTHRYNNAIADNFDDIKPNGCHEIGFMWNDFEVDPTILLTLKKGRGFCYGKQLTHDVLHRPAGENYVKGVFRAHQHDLTLTPMMKSILEGNGVSKLWQESPTQSNNLWNGIVCTFLVAPYTPYSKKGALYDYDAFGLLKTAQIFEDWQLEMHQNKITNS